MAPKDVEKAGKKGAAAAKTVQLQAADYLEKQTVYLHVRQTAGDPVVLCWVLLSGK